MKKSFKIAAVAMAALMTAPNMAGIAQAASAQEALASNGQTIIERALENEAVKTGPKITIC